MGEILVQLKGLEGQKSYLIAPRPPNHLSPLGQKKLTTASAFTLCLEHLNLLNRQIVDMVG